jgi:hypothetical protein
VEAILLRELFLAVDGPEMRGTVHVEKGAVREINENVEGPMRAPVARGAAPQFRPDPTGAVRASSSPPSRRATGASRTGRPWLANPA